MKKHFSKWMALMLALTMLCLCLGACGEPDTPATDPAASTNKPADKPADTTGSTQPASEPITITFWHGIVQENMQKTLYEIVTDFPITTFVSILTPSDFTFSISFATTFCFGRRNSGIP